MDENGELTLNLDCLLEILNYVITDCSLKDDNVEEPSLRYNDLINFVLAHECIIELLALHHKRLYEELELVIACRITKLLIDLSINKMSCKQNKCFWEYYLQSIREKNPFNVELTFDVHNNKKDHPHVTINIKGISSNHSNAETLRLDGKITADELADICIWNPNLRRLAFESNVVDGSVSNIARHCENLEELKISFNAEDGIVQYTQLAQLPNLKRIIITGVQDSGSQVLFFKDLKKWHRPRSMRPLIMTLEDSPKKNCHTSQLITFAALDSLQNFEKYFSYYYEEFIKIEYDLCKMTEDVRSIKESLITLPEVDDVKIVFDSYKEELEVKLHYESDISKLSPLSKLPNLNRLVIRNRCTDLCHSEAIAKFLRSMVSLKSCKIHYGSIGELEAKELAKIESIRFLGCHFWSWNSIMFLTDLPHLQHVVINVRDPIDPYNSKLVLDLMTACQVQATIMCNKFGITFKRDEKKLKIEMKKDCQANILSCLAQLNNVNTLQISGNPEPASLNSFFEAFVGNNYNTLKELDIDLHYRRPCFKDISKVAEIRSVEKLKCSLGDTTGIEKLSELNKLQKIHISGWDLSPLFRKMAEINTIQCICCEPLDPKLISHISQIRSLKKLESISSAMLSPQSFAELASTSIEEIIFGSPRLSLEEFLHAFSSNGNTGLHHLQVHKFEFSRRAETMELKCLKSLRVKYLLSECAPMLKQFPNLEYLAIENFYNSELKACMDLLNTVTLQSLPSTLTKLELNFQIGFNECNHFVELEKLQSLKCSLRDELGLEVLAHTKNLKELIIDDAKGSLTGLFRAFALKSDSKLQELHALTNLCSDEVRELSGIKSLKLLNLWYETVCDNLRDLGQLIGLETVRIVRPFWEGVDVESVLPLFESWQKLRVATLEGDGVASNLASNIYKIHFRGRYDFL
ncbi:uncharacterized protein LOC122817771 isoform X2 [Drosophila biarmipes]|nr:uncharacterized protein LOC122817771 isoform X2 [Drosophila biarmipes]